MPDGKGKRLMRDLETNEALRRKLDDPVLPDADAEKLVDSWDMLDDVGYSQLRKNPVSLEKLKNLLSNPKLADAGLDGDIVKQLIKGNRGPGAVALNDLTKGLDDLVTSGTKFDDIGKLAAEFNKGGGFAEGARWIQRAITKNTDEFAGKTLKFEETLKAGENLRRVDVRVREGLNDIFYEFKSVTEIPPANFAKQFVNDMNLSEVTDLDQLKWVFDGKKVGDLGNHIDDFMNALESTDISEDVIKKLVKGIDDPAKDNLLDLIEANFDEIFRIK